MDQVIGVAIVGAVLAAIAVVIRALWRKITDPETARRAGASVRSTIDKTASAAGQASGTIETVARSAKDSFSQGRSATKPQKSDDPSTGA